MGDRRNGKGVIVACLPYQVAARRRTSVSSPSSDMFKRLLAKGRYARACEFHSHAHSPPSRIPLGDYLWPSKDDLLCAGRGRAEIIVEVMRSSRNASFLRKRGRKLAAAMGRFRLLMGAFTYLGKYEGEMVHDEPDLRILG